MDPSQNLFYCYGRGRGGDVIRFAELYHQVKFPQALGLLRQWRGWASLLQEAVSFYRMQLHRHAEAVAYLLQRGVRSPELIEHMRIGYAPGGCLRAWLAQLGYPLSALRDRKSTRLNSSHSQISYAVFCLKKKKIKKKQRVPQEDGSLHAVEVEDEAGRHNGAGSDGDQGYVNTAAMVRVRARTISLHRRL